MKDFNVSIKPDYGKVFVLVHYKSVLGGKSLIHFNSIKEIEAFSEQLQEAIKRYKEEQYGTEKRRI